MRLLKRLVRSDAVRRLAATLIALYLRLTLGTTRWTIEAPDEAWAHMLARDGRNAIVAFWHEFLPLSPVLFWHASRLNPSLDLHVLISRHRDGQMITDVVARWGVKVVAGSSDRPKPGEARARTDRGGASAMRRLLGLLRSGGLIVVTPDGPRGPRHVLQPGIVRLAALSGTPIVPMAAHCSRGRQFASWDRMTLPLPFGRGRVVCGPPIEVPARDWETMVPVVTDALQAVALKAGAHGARG